MVLTTIKKWTVHSWKTVFGRTHITLKGAKKSRHNKALEHTGVSCGWKECDAKDTLIAGEAQTPIGESRATLKPIKSFKLGATREANWRPKSTSLTHTHRPSGKLRRRTSAIPQTKPRPKHESRETGFAWGGGRSLKRQQLRSLETDTHPDRGNRFGQGLLEGRARACAICPPRPLPHTQSPLPSELRPSWEPPATPSWTTPGGTRQPGSSQGGKSTPASGVGRPE